MFTDQWLRHPIIFLAVAAEAGVLAGVRLGTPWVWWCAAVCDLGIVFMRPGWRARAWGLCLATVCVYAALAGRAEQGPARSIARWAPAEKICVEGRLREWPTGTTSGEAWQADVECAHVLTATGCVPVSGGMRLRVPGSVPAFSAGDLVRVQGRLETWEGPGNPGEFDYRTYSRRAGIYGQCRVGARTDLVRLEAVRGWSAWGAAGHRHWTRAIRRWVPKERAEVVCSLVLGERSGLPRTLQESMAATGLAHVFAVSGMNLGLVLGSVYGLGRWLRVPRVWLLSLAFVGVACFANMVGTSPSIGRAWWMAWLGLWGVTMRRHVDGLSVLSAVALVWLACDPLSGVHPGFLLSFTATAALFLAAAHVPQVPLPGWWGGGLQKLVDGMGMTVAALLGTLPLQMYYFYSVTPVAVLSNVLALPLVALGTDGGLLLGVLDPAVPWLAKWVGYLTGWSAQGLVAVAQWAERIPHARIVVWGIGSAWVVGCYAAGLAVCWKPLRPWGIVALCVCLVAYAHARPPRLGEDITQFTFLDLGLGEATLLEQGETVKILLDAGTEAEFLWRVKPFLTSQGIRRLSALVISHPDTDHAGGAELCVKYFKPHRVITAHSGEATLSRLRDAVHRSGGVLEEVSLDSTLRWSPHLTAQVIWPEVGFESTGEPRAGGRPRRPRARRSKTALPRSFSNDRSLVLVWSFPGGRALLTGDAGEVCEDVWGSLPTCRLLKVAHHGSKKSTGLRLLRRVQPEWGVVQPGFFQTRYFPHPDTVARFAALGIPLLNTASLGAVRIRFDGQGGARWESWK